MSYQLPPSSLSHHHHLGGSLTRDHLPDSFEIPSSVGALKKQVSRKKHWPLILSVQLPKTTTTPAGEPATINLETNTQTKIKALKELIKERAPADAGLENVPAERLILQVEGGDVLKKGTATIEEMGLKDRTSIIVTISDKPINASQSTRERKAKDEQKVGIIYTVRRAGVAAAAEGGEEESEAAGGVTMINTSSEAPKETKTIEITPSSKVKQLRQAIKDDLGIKDKVSLKLYLPPKAIEESKRPLDDQEETKEGDVLGSLLEVDSVTGDQVVADDKLTLV